MPTILELFKDPSKFQFGTNYESAVKDDKNIIEAIASKTSKIRRQTGVDLNNPLIYGTGEKFMNYFGIADLNELPKTKDFKIIETSWSYGMNKSKKSSEIVIIG